MNRVYIFVPCPYTFSVESKKKLQYPRTIMSCQKAPIPTLIFPANPRENISRAQQVKTIAAAAAASTAGNPPRCTAIYFSTHKIVERIVLVFSNIYRIGCFSLRCRFFFLLFFFSLSCVFLCTRYLFQCLLPVCVCVYSLCGRLYIVWLEFFTGNAM